MGIVLLMNCLLFYTSGCKKEMDKAKRHYEQALEYREQDLPDQAIKELEQAIKINPDYAEAHYQLGVLYYEKEDFTTAMRELQRAVSISPDHADAHYWLGILFQKLRGYQQALDQFEEVLRINPKFARIHTAVGNVYFERGLRAWGRAIKLDWSYVVPDTLKQISYENKDKLKKAVDDYLNVVESDTTNAAAFAKLSHAYLTWAEDEYQRAVAVDSFDTSAQLQLGLTFSYKGYQNKAMKQYEILKDMEPKAAEMLIQAIRKEQQGAEELKRRGMRK